MDPPGTASAIWWQQNIWHTSSYNNLNTLKINLNKEEERKKKIIKILCRIRRYQSTVSIPQSMGSSLGPVHRSTGLVEILTRVQKLDKAEHVSRSQRVQCSCALDPSLSPIYVCSSKAVFKKK
jgi:hypothetical protein